jgi:hypothetical protein
LKLILDICGINKQIVTEEWSVVEVDKKVMSVVEIYYSLVASSGEARPGVDEDIDGVEIHMR